jgi:hypothetical protein
LCFIWTDVTTAADAESLNPPTVHHENSVHVERKECYVNENNYLFSRFVQAKAVIMVLLTSYSAYQGHNNAQKADTEEHQRLDVGKLKKYHTLSNK